MKNVTLSLPEETARWARIEAAKADKSLSKWVSERLEEERSSDVHRRSDGKWPNQRDDDLHYSRNQDSHDVPPLEKKSGKTKDAAYRKAAAHLLSQKPVKLREPGEELPKREEIYDRPILHRH